MHVYTPANCIKVSRVIDPKKTRIWTVHRLLERLNIRIIAFLTVVVELSSKFFLKNEKWFFFQLCKLLYNQLTIIAAAM